MFLCRENNKDEFTLFQYFGLSDGLAFTYPAYEVHESSCYPSKKAYDPASRPWFSAAAVGPANIVILFDSSNSMKMFRRLEMAKDAVLALIDSIDDNSYLNVVTVTTTTIIIKSNKFYLLLIYYYYFF